MNTKSIIGLVVVIAIIVGGTIWVMKAPASPEQPVVTEPVTTTDPVSTVPTTPATVTTPTTTPAPAVKGGIISTKTVNGMKIEVTKEGSGPAIANGQTAVMLYTGKLADGSVFDASSKHGNEPLSFTLGAGEVIKGWDQGILGMKVGGKRTLTIPSELGYGSNGYPPVIPQNATLTFDVELVGIK